MGSYGFVLKWSIPINGTLIWKSWEFDCWVPMFRQTHMGMGQNLGSCLRLFIYVFMIHLLGYLILTHIDARKWALVSGKKKNILMLNIPTNKSFVHFVDGHKVPYFWCILPKCTYTIVMPLQMTRQAWQKSQVCSCFVCLCIKLAYLLIRSCNWRFGGLNLYLTYSIHWGYVFDTQYLVLLVMFAHKWRISTIVGCWVIPFAGLSPIFIACIAIMTCLEYASLLWNMWHPPLGVTLWELTTSRNIVHLDYRTQWGITWWIGNPLVRTVLFDSRLNAGWRLMVTQSQPRWACTEPPNRLRLGRQAGWMKLLPDQVGTEIYHPYNHHTCTRPLRPKKA